MQQHVQWLLININWIKSVRICKRFAGIKFVGHAPVYGPFYKFFWYVPPKSFLGFCSPNITPGAFKVRNLCEAVFEDVWRKHKFRKNKNWSEKKKREQPKNEGNASTLSEHIDHVLEECSLVFPRTRLWKLEGGRTFSLASKWAIGHKLVSPLTGREVGTR